MSTGEELGLMRLGNNFMKYYKLKKFGSPSVENSRKTSNRQMLVMYLDRYFYSNIQQHRLNHRLLLVPHPEAALYRRK